MKLVKSAALLVAVGLGVSAAAVPRATDAAGPTFTYEVLLDGTGTPATHSKTFLNALNIQEDRVAHIYDNLAELGLPGYALELTAAEATEAGRIALDDGDVRAFGRAGEMGVEPFGFATAPSDDIAGQPALARHGMPDKLEPCATDLEGSTVSITCASPVVAVLDTGVDLANPDLNTTAGFNAVEPGKPILDVGGHGTFVSSVIRSAAPNTTIVPVKVLGDSGSGTTADIIAGYDFIAGLVLSGQRVDVINMSLGGQNPPTTCGEGEDYLHEAVCALAGLDVATVVSAGNSAADAKFFSPANYPEAFTVSAIADYDGEPGGKADTPPVPWAVASLDDALATFSNYGEVVDGTAVGVGNYGLTPSTWTSPAGEPGRISVSSGTSFSGPLWAAAIARYRAANPDQSHRIAFAQVSRYSSLYGGAFTGDPDGVAEPVLWLGEVPRWEG